MRLTEQTVNRLKKLAGLKELDSKSPQHIALKKGKGEKFKPSPPPPQPQSSGGVSCDDPNWVNMSMGDPIGEPNYNALKYNYCDRCGYNWSGIDMGVDQGGLEVPAYIGMDVNDQLPGEISWMVGPPWAPFADNVGDDWSLGNFCECCVEAPEIEGCTDNQAVNYNSSATEDDGSCYWNIYACSPGCEYVQIGTVGAGGTIDESNFLVQTFFGATYFMGNNGSDPSNYTDDLPPIQGGWIPWYNEPWGTYAYNIACTTDPGDNLLNTEENPNESTISAFYGGITSAPGTQFANPWCEGQPISINQFCEDEAWSNSAMGYYLC